MIVVPSFQGKVEMNDLQRAFCQGFEPLDKHISEFGVFFRHGEEEDEDDLSAFLDDGDDEQHHLSMSL